jgi:uncharacterized protein YcbK (DUF882 family)
MSITMKELLGENNLADLPQEHQENLLELLVVANKIRDAYGKPLIVSSGYRSMKEHLAIYAKKGITDVFKIPTRSQHLYGLAVDFADPKGNLQKFIMDNQDLLEDLNIFLENFDYTATWTHLQIEPFKSYKPGGLRFFKP